ncbi:MAG: GNAT family N-acetyltransferase [Actinomycetota bacterium]|nr:GNAT family N-acetyltransferase [Actinomycetota bacterium]
MAAVFTIRSYEPADEVGWLRCRLLSFFGSAFWDDVQREKDRYPQPAVELVAEDGGEIVGLLDLEVELKPGVLADRPGCGGMIWSLAVHPDHQRQGIASALLEEAERRGRERGLERLEAWTRDDEHVQRWYETHGFVLIDGYLHVYLERDDLPALDGQLGELRLIKAFAHYNGDRPEEIRQRYGRVHDDVLYEKQL